MGNPLCHFEFMVSDMEKAKTFYQSIFDWEIKDAGMPGYLFINTGSEPEGGLTEKPPEATAYSLGQYFLVDNIDETLEKVISNGGEVLVQKSEIPNIGYYAVFLDPDKISVGLFESSK